MRISQQTALVVTACSVGGLALAIVLGSGVRHLEIQSNQLGPNSITMREITYLKTAADQWFVTVDLIFNEGKIYLAQGVQSQAVELQHVLDDLERSPLLKEANREQFILARDLIKRVSQRATEVTTLRGSGLESQLNQIVASANQDTKALIQTLDTLSLHADRRSEDAIEALKSKRLRLIQVGTLLGFMYIAAIVSVWRWVSVNIVRPLERLTIATQQAGDTIESFNIKESGPYEIRQLTRDIRDQIAALQAARWMAEDSSRKSREMADRANAVTATAAEGIFTLDEKGKILSFNKAAQNIFQYEIHRIIGRHVSTIVPSYFGDCDSTNVNDCSLLVPDQVTCSGLELKAKHNDGTKFPIELSVSVMDRGVFTVIVRDITRRKENEEKVKKLNNQLVEASRHAGMAEIASGVLHNIGNVLTIVNVSATDALNKTRACRVSGLSKTADLINEHSGDLAAFFGSDPRGQQMPTYLTKLATELEQKQSRLGDDLESLLKHVEHVKEIINLQQAYARGGSAVQTISIEELVEDAVGMNADRLEKYSVEVVREYSHSTDITIDKHKALQILVNLIRNATDAMADNNGRDRRLTIAIERVAKDALEIAVGDTGTGISSEHINRIFQHGFTTKKDGHGFGLHGSANAVKEMGGKLAVESDGRGLGATFRLSLPLKPREILS